MKLLVKCNPGTEDLASEEFLEEVEGGRVLREARGRGRLIVEVLGEPSLVLDQVSSLRSIHSVVMLLSHGEVSKGREGLEQISSLVESSGIEDYLPYLSTFAVESERVGEGHEYTSMDIASVVGESVIKVVKARRGWAPEVRLNSPHVIIYAEVNERDFLLGITVTGERSLHIRRYRVYNHPAALKPTLAYAMLRLSGARDGDSILDPMCGGGTIPLEAALLFESSKIYCMDKVPRHVRGARLNAITARVEGRIEFIVGDATRLTEFFEESSIDRIVTNPPYGIRLGSPGSVRAVYKGFLKEAGKVLAEAGTLTLITTESEFVKRFSKGLGLRVTHERSVKHGDLWASILVLEKKG